MLKEISQSLKIRSILIKKRIKMLLCSGNDQTKCVIISQLAFKCGVNLEIKLAFCIYFWVDFDALYLWDIILLKVLLSCLKQLCTTISWYLP